jgi:hypothetical protein
LQNAFPVPEVRQSVMEKLWRLVRKVPAGAKVRRCKMKGAALASERALIGAIIVDPDRAWREVADLGLVATDFTDATNRRAFAAILRLRSAGKPITETTLQDTGLTLPELTKLVDGAESAAAARYHATAIRGAALQRRAHDEIRTHGGTPEGLRLALRQIEESLPDVDSGGVATQTLAELADPVPETENEAALFRNGWLRKGGGAFLVSTSGTGKSVASIQCALLWAMGLPAFGVEPVKRLRIAIIQAEDDAEEMADFRNQITGGLIDGGLDREAVLAAGGNIILADGTGKTGEGFTTFVGELLRARPDIDLLIVNPLQSFFGGDISRNAELSQFLRTWLDPVIKPGRVGVLFVHHTNKPPASKDRKGWGADTFSAYVGAGGAEIVNWCRAVLALMPCEAVPGLFRLVAGKRGGRLGWHDSDGNKTNTRFIAHSEGRIFWRDATPEEIEQAQGQRSADSFGDAKADAETLADHARQQALTLTALRSYAKDTMGNARGRRAFDHLKGHVRAFSLSLVQAKYKNTVFAGTRPDAEQAARSFDTEKGVGK